MLNFLTGNEITLIKVSRSQLILILENSISISIESKTTLQLPTGTIEYKQGDFSQIKEILELLGKKVKSVEEGGNELKISFDNDHLLILPNKNEGYESYVITHEGEVYVVGE